jgi:eukaryotic-like serine/threonine-protein kinase
VLQVRVEDPHQVGPFRILGGLGSGGMGQVFLGAGARGELVAVKVVHPGLAHDTRFRVRFAGEVAAGRRVRGPGIAEVVAADPDAPLPWLATEYVRGVPLDRAVRAAGPLPAESVHVLAIGLAHALATVHAAGLVHRDVKPPNVLLAADRPYLIDFGIAQALDVTQLSATGALVGTPAFMSPEHAEGHPVGQASDVFSLGAVLTYAALGRGPFGDTNPMVLLRRIVDDAADLHGLDEPVHELVVACLAKRPADRPTAAELTARLGPMPTTPPGAPAGAWLPASVVAMIPPLPDVPTLLRTTAPGFAPAAVPSPARMPPGPPPVRRRAVLTGVAALGLAAVAGVATAVALTSRSTPAPVAPPPPPTTPPPPPSAAPPLPGTATPRWTVAAPIRVSAIAVDGATVFVGGDGSVIALDRAAGAGRWHYTAPHSGGPEHVRLDAADGTVCVETRGALIALDPATGSERWRLVARSPAGFEHIMPGPGTVYAADGQALLALDATTGAERWRHTVAGKFANSITTDGGRVFVSDASTVDAVDTATGERHWQYRGGTDTGQTLTVADATVFVDSHGGMVALDAASGAVRWEASLDADILVTGRPVVAGGAIVVIGSDEQLIALDTVTGAVRWDGTDSTGGDYVRIGPAGTPGGRYVYAAGENGRVIAVDGATGKRHWTYPAPAAHTWVRALAVADGTAYVGSTDEVWAITPA